MLRLRIHNLGDVTVFRCLGRITADDGNALRNAVMNQPHIRVAVLDMAEVSAVDAAGLGMLVSLRAWAKATDKNLKLMNLTPRVEEVLELTRLRSAFDICSVQEMVDLLCRAANASRVTAAATATGQLLQNMFATA